MPAESGRRPSHAAGSNIRGDIARTARLWGLALICASVGSYTVWRTDALQPGVLAFLITLAILGPLLWIYERRRR